MNKSSQLLSVAAFVLAGVALLPGVAHATIVVDYGLCNASDGCNQTVNFAPANNGTTVVGDTNPNPKYNVFVDSLENLTLHGSGSNVDTGPGGSGFLSILIRPESGWAWGAIDFNLDSLIGNFPTGSPGLTFTATDQFGSSFLFPANFPWEGNNGENQQYHLHGTLGELITSLQITYNAPLLPGVGANRIQDIHNIDVNSHQLTPIPEPTTLTLLGLGLVGVGYSRRKKA